MCNIRCFYLLRELYDADFHKPGIYGSGRVLPNACDVFPRMPSRVGRCRRVGVGLVVCFGWGRRIFLSLCVCVCVFFFVFFSSERTRPAASMKPLLASMTSLLVYTILRSSLNSSSRYQGCVFTRVFIHVPGIFLHFILICFSPSWRLTPLWHLLPLW